MKISDRIRLIEALVGPLIIAGGLLAAVVVPRSSDIALATISGGFAYMVRSINRGEGDDITINRYPVAGAPDEAIGVRLDRTPEKAIVSSDVYETEPAINRESAYMTRSSSGRGFDESNQLPTLIVNAEIPEFDDNCERSDSFVGTNKLGVTEEDLDNNLYSESP